jgi:hypothetical protein
MSSLARTILKLVLLGLSVALLLFLSLVGAALVHYGSSFSFGFDEARAPATANVVGSAWQIGGLTLLGVLASLAVNTLRAQNPDTPVNFRALFRAMLYPQTFVAICVSPIVFFGALIAFQGKELGPPLFLAAFQNGFFWQRILDGRKTS